MQDVATVVGVGPGLGESVARRFAQEHYSVALLARSEERLQSLEASLEDCEGSTTSVPCDATQPESVEKAFDHIRDTLGHPSVLVYNAGTFQPGGFLDIEPERFVDCWEANCYGGFLTAREVIPAMQEEGEGTVLFTGATASWRGSEGFSTLAVGKFGLRALAQSLAREFGPQGIHVSHVVIDGQIDTPRVREMFPDRADHTFLDPDEIAETYWQLHVQDPTAWTLELDLRPAVEDF